MARAVGLDFGTTNSAIAVSDDGDVRLATYAYEDVQFEVFRSVLFFEQPEGGSMPTALAGPEAIETYLDGVEGRLIQSLKTFLGSQKLPRSNIFNRVYSFEQLISFFLISLRRKAEEQLGPLGAKAVVGRPVKYATPGIPAPDEVPLERMRTALAGAGFTDVTFEYEPVGAAYVYDTDPGRDQTVLVADFGGGTSDFCLMKIGPSTGGRALILGTDGEPLAGDTFDARIVREVIAPALGRKTRYRASTQWMDIPTWLYSHLEQWHHLSFLRERKTMDLLLDLTASAEEPQKLRNFLYLIRNGLGFHIHQAVQAAKVGLSESDSARVVLQQGPLDLDVEVTRTEFEYWIADDVLRIENSVERLMQRVGIEPADLDHVFMTGGTSFVPAVQRIFTERFGAERVLTGAAFTSVAAGLARRAETL